MHKKAHMAGIAFSIIFGLSFYQSKILLNHMSPIALIAYRFLLAFIVFELLRQFKLIKINVSLRKFMPLSIFIIGLFQPVAYFLFETFGLSYIPSSEAGLMIALIPIFVTIMSAIILKEKPKTLQVFFILLSFAGVITIQLSKVSLNLNYNILGFILLLLAALSAAAFNIASRSGSKKHKPFEITYYMTFLGMITFNSIYLIQLGIQGNMVDYVQQLLNINVILRLMYLSIAASIVGFILVNYTLSKLPAHVSSIYSNFATVVSVIAGYFLLNEQVTIYHMIGGALIIFGIYGNTRVNYINKRMRLKK